MLIPYDYLPSSSDDKSEKEKYEASKYFDCYPSWQGEYGDNVPHYNFCQFMEKSKPAQNIMQMQTSNSTQQPQQGAVQESRKSLYSHTHSDSGWGLYRGNSNMTKFQIFQIFWA